MPVQYHHCLQPFLADFLRQPFGLTNSQTEEKLGFTGILFPRLFSLYLRLKSGQKCRKSQFSTQK